MLLFSYTRHSRLPLKRRNRLCSRRCNPSKRPTGCAAFLELPLRERIERRAGGGRGRAAAKFSSDSGEKPYRFQLVEAHGKRGCKRQGSIGGKIIFKQIFIAASAAAAILTPGVAQAQSVAPGQSKADYLAWLAQSPENREKVRFFRDFLTEKQVQDVVPLWQIVRTSSSWRQCSANPFEVAPSQQWDNIVQTLAFVKNEVKPAIGEVEALSGFRNEHLNDCSNGKPRSAHRMFFAMDLVPADQIDRGDMIAQLCSAHARRGADYRAGLGFYSGSRFHVDSSGFRKWGADGRGASSPCNGGLA